MLTDKQEKWLVHLSGVDRIVIKPYDPTSPKKFEKVKKRIQKYLGKNIRVEHHGATGLGISGQDEIDMYVPVAPTSFDKMFPQLKKLFGEPASYYPLERVRFVTHVAEKHIDVFLINEESEAWINGVKFETYLSSHPKSLEEYRKLKEKGNGLIARKYYRRKINFINKILSKVK
jgi:GrpB-like predicted nucleotidyltransferase (UPF0157 family)